MALTGTITIHGATAGAVFHDSGAINLSPFSSFSAFLSDQFSFGSSGYTEIDSAKLALKSQFGKVVFHDNDTISASYGGDTVISGSVSIDFVFGSTTTSLFSTPYSDTLPGGASAALTSALAAAAGNSSLGGAASTLASFEHELLKPTTSATVPAATGATNTPDLSTAPAATTLNLGEAKATLVTLHKPETKA